MSLKVSKLWFRLTRFEFWPFWVIYFPIVWYYLYLSIRARSIFFFSTSNPGIEFSGMLGESKINIYRNINPKYIPITEILSKSATLQEVEEKMATSNLQYPVVLKPDRGERGWMVKIIRNSAQLQDYLNENRVDFLIQEWINQPLELAIFYFRHPNSASGTVSSIAAKEFFQVIGDGKKTLVDLIDQDARGSRFKEELLSQTDLNPESIPLPGEKIRVGQIGNHSLGTIFTDGNSRINDKIESRIDEVARAIDGFYFGRFDIRCESFEKLEEGEFKILELNGSGSEPAHIFDPDFEIFQAYRDIAYHLKMMFEISVSNHKLGVPYMTMKEFFSMIAIVRSYRSLQ